MGLHTVYSTGYSLLGHHSTGHWALGTLADQHKQTWQRSPWVLGSIIPGTLLPFVGPLWAVTGDKSFTCSEKGIVRLNMAASSSLGLYCSLALAVPWPLLFHGPCCSMAHVIPSGHCCSGPWYSFPLTAPSALVGPCWLVTYKNF